MFEFVAGLFDATGFVPRQDCGQWTKELIWLHVSGDLFIWLACIALPLVLLYFTRRRDLPYSALFVLFALFILAAGFGHLIEALMFKYPLDRLAGVWKVLTAVVSWVTVLALIPVIPQVMRTISDSTPSPSSRSSALGDTTLHRLAAPSDRERLTDYIIAILVAVLALLLRAAVDSVVESDHVYVLSLLAVVFVSWQSGFGPGIITLCVSMVGMVYFFIPIRHTFVIEGFGNQLATAMFFFCGVCCAGLGEAQRIARRGAKAALTVALERKAELESEVARRREVEEAIRESELRFRSMADSAPALIWLSELDRRRTYFNKTWLAFTGRRIEQELGEGWIENLHPDDRERYLREYTAAFVSREPFELEYRLRRHDGEYRWVMARGTPRFTPSGTFAGFVGLCLDVTDRKRAVEDLRRSEQNLSDFFENANVGLHWIGPDGVILRANRAELEMLGYTREEYVGRHIAEFHTDPEAIADILARLGRGERLDNCPSRVRHRNGSTRDVLISSTALFEEGRFVHSRCFTRDVTELKLAEEQQAERARVAALRADVAAALVATGGNRPALQGCAETLVRHTGAAFARVWTTDPRGEWLELQASAGMYTHTDSPHGRVRVGEFKIGQIASDARPHLTNDVPHDPNVSDPEWAIREKMVAFAGYPLVVEGRVLGVMALFARRELSEALLADLAPVAETIAQYLERRRSEAAIRTSEGRYRTLTEAIPQMVWNAGPDGEATYFNQRWLEYTGVPIAEAHGRGWLAAVHPEDVDRVHTAWQLTVLNHKKGEDRFSHELRLKRAADGEYRWMLSVAVPLRRSDGSVDQWIGSMADIDDQKRQAENLERIVQERTTALRITNDALIEEIDERKRAVEHVRAVATELSRSNAELEQFAYVASHDLQEPLSKIQAFGDRLRTRVRDDLPVVGKEYVDRMLTSAGRMRRLIDDLLNYSRVTTQARPFSRVDLGKIAREAVNDLSERIEEVHGEVHIDPLPEIDADPTQLRQLFQNLIANAVKFQRPGVPPVVEVSGELVTEPSPNPGGEPQPACRVSVRDNGIGFDEKYLDRIFQVFQRLHGKEEYEGTGVGLAICRKISERHMGTITARSRIGEGATFLVTLPVRQPYPADLPSESGG